MSSTDPERDQSDRDPHSPKSASTEHNRKTVRETQSLGMAESPANTHRSDCHGNNPEEKFPKTKLLSSILTAATVGAFLAAVYYASQAHEANKLTRCAFIASQRAALYLGWPDGRIGGFTKSGKGKSERAWVVLYFRNYGRVAAENVLIELWPTVVIANKPAINKPIPAFQGFHPTGWSEAGISIPPGFPYKKPYPINSDQLRLVERGKDSGLAELHILGRLSYTDRFGQYCQAFSLEYAGSPLNELSLLPTPHRDYCGGQPQIATYSMQIIKMGTKPVHIWLIPTPTPIPEQEQKYTK